MMHESRNDETHCMKKISYLNKGTAVLLKESSKLSSKIKVIFFKKNGMSLDQDTTNATGYTDRLPNDSIIFQY